MISALQRSNIALGSFFFRFRNAFFPIVFLLALGVMRPRVAMGRPGLDRFLTTLGGLVALAGAGLRLATIGFEYIERGGKNKRVYASRLVQRGVYAHTRNPMYVANTLIVVGICMLAGSPAAYGIVIPFFLFVYQAIVAAEEDFLRRKFGQEYEEYRARVPRFIPSLRGARESFAGMTYNWRRAVRQDLSTLLMVSMSLILLPVWRSYFLQGSAAVGAAAPRALAIALGVGLVYAVLVYLKKTRRFFYEPNR